MKGWQNSRWERAENRALLDGVAACTFDPHGKWPLARIASAIGCNRNKVIAAQRYMYDATAADFDAKHLASVRAELERRLAAPPPPAPAAEIPKIATSEETPKIATAQSPMLLPTQPTLRMPPLSPPQLSPPPPCRPTREEHEAYLNREGVDVVRLLRRRATLYYTMRQERAAIHAAQVGWDAFPEYKRQAIENACMLRLKVDVCEGEEEWRQDPKGWAIRWHARNPRDYAMSMSQQLFPGVEFEDYTHSQVLMNLALRW